MKLEILSSVEREKWIEMKFRNDKDLLVVMGNGYVICLLKTTALSYIDFTP